MAMASSAAVNLPLFLMMPPTKPAPNSMSVLSHMAVSHPAFRAAMAADTPAQPPPTMTTS